MKLSKDAYQQAQDFVHKHARALDRTLMDYQLGADSKESVEEELVKYQNADGGFGNGIEPDFRLRTSSPMATSVGLQYGIEIELNYDNPVIEGAIQYLVSTFDSKGVYWPATFKDVNDEPHAPWWHVDKVKPPDESSWPNPSAELLGYLHRYSKYVPQDMIELLNKRALANLESSNRVEGLFYNVMCWERIYQFLPEPMKSLAKKRIIQTFKEKMPLTQDVLGEIRIFWLAPNRDALMLTKPENVYQLLEDEIGKQSEDGGWWPTWKWGMYEDVWPLAEREWAGKMTVKILGTLRAFNLVEGEDESGSSN